MALLLESALENIYQFASLGATRAMKQWGVRRDSALKMRDI